MCEMISRSCGVICDRIAKLALDRRAEIARLSYASRCIAPAKLELGARIVVSVMHENTSCEEFPVASGMHSQVSPACTRDDETHVIENPAPGAEAHGSRRTAA